MIGIGEYDGRLRALFCGGVQGFAEIFLSHSELNPDSSPRDRVVHACFAISALKDSNYSLLEFLGGETGFGVQRFLLLVVIFGDR